MVTKRIAFLLLSLFMLLWSGACLPQEHPPKRSFAIQELLIDESAFPPGWSVSTAGPRPPAKAPLGHYESIESTELFFYVYGGSAFEEIHRFSSVQGAAREFRRKRDLEFAKREIDTPWVVPPELSYQSPAANQFYLACATQGGIPMCRAIGQYEEYFVKFNTHMSPDFMTHADLERVLKAIDERMASYLGR